MSFVRDKDAATRGVNAVAAYDMTSRRGRALEERKQRMMLRRDRYMAAAARGGLGAIDSVKVGGNRAPTIVPGYGGDLQTPPPVGKPPGGSGGGGGAPRKIFVGARTVATSTAAPRRALVLDPMSTTPSGEVRPGRPLPGGVTVTGGGQPYTDPLPPPSSPPEGGTTIGTGTNPVVSAPGGGGGGYTGGGGGGGGGGAATDPSDLDLGPGVAEPTGASSSTMKTAALIGGGLLLAYLLFGKDE